MKRWEMNPKFWPKVPKEDAVIDTLRAAVGEAHTAGMTAAEIRESFDAIVAAIEDVAE